MSRREVIGSAVAGALASGSAVFTFWLLGTYSQVCERDIVGTAITVWCAVVIRIMLWAEKKGEEE